MDLVTLALAKQYTDSQRIGHIDAPEPILWDGDISGLHTFVTDEVSLVRISPEVPDLRRANHIEVWARTPEKTGPFVEFTKNNIEVVEDEELPGVIQLVGIGGIYYSKPTELALSVEQDCDIGLIYGEEPGKFVLLRGTYLYFLPITADFTSALYVRTIEFSETIHPIDQKFIPALDSLTLNGPDGRQYKVYVNESGELVTEEVVTAAATTMNLLRPEVTPDG